MEREHLARHHYRAVDLVGDAMDVDDPVLVLEIPSAGEEGRGGVEQVADAQGLCVGSGEIGGPSVTNRQRRGPGDRVGGTPDGLGQAGVVDFDRIGCRDDDRHVVGSDHHLCVDRFGLDGGADRIEVLDQGTDLEEQFDARIVLGTHRAAADRCGQHLRREGDRCLGQDLRQGHRL